MKNIAIATRYAKALFELAQARHLELKAESDLRIFSAGLTENKGAVEFFRNPVATLEEKKSILSKICAGKIDPLVLQFLTVLVTHNRFDFLEPAIKAFHVLLNESRHFEEVILTTARPLKTDLRKSIEKMLEKKIGQKIVSETKVDPKLLGGINIQIRHRLFDGSVRSKLDELRKQMTGVPS